MVLPPQGPGPLGEPPTPIPIPLDDPPQEPKRGPFDEPPPPYDPTHPPDQDPVPIVDIPDEE